MRRMNRIQTIIAFNMASGVCDHLRTESTVLVQMRFWRNTGHNEIVLIAKSSGDEGPNDVPKGRLRNAARAERKSGREDSNLRPRGSEPRALARLSHAPLLKLVNLRGNF